MPGQSSQRRKYRLTVKLDPEWDADLTYLQGRSLQQVHVDFSPIRGTPAASPFAPYDLAIFLQQFVFVLQMAGGYLLPPSCQVSATLPHASTAAGDLCIEIGVWAVWRGFRVAVPRPSSQTQQYHSRWRRPNMLSLLNSSYDPPYRTAIPPLAHQVLQAMAHLSGGGWAAVFWHPGSGWWQVGLLEPIWQEWLPPEASALDLLTQQPDARSIAPEIAATIDTVIAFHMPPQNWRRLYGPDSPRGGDLSHDLTDSQSEGGKNQHQNTYTRDFLSASSRDAAGPDGPRVIATG
jgi:hypothetical protein